MSEMNVSSGGTSGPNIWSYGGYQIALYVNASLNVIICKRQRIAGNPAQWQQFDTSNLTTLLGTASGGFPAPPVTINPLGCPIEDDDHDTPALGIDGDGFIHVSRFTQPVGIGIDTVPRIIRSKRSLSDPSFLLTEWYDIRGELFDNAVLNHSYNQYAAFNNGALLLRHGSRSTTDNAHNPGLSYLYVKEPGATHFANRGTPMIGGLATDVTQDAFYYSQPYVDANDRVHFFGAWRQNIGPGSQTPIIGYHSYFYSDDHCLTFRNVNGTLLNVPMTRLSADAISCRTVVADADTQNNLYTFGVTVDALGHPVGTYDKVAGTALLVKRDAANANWVVDHSVSYFGGGQGLNIVNFNGDLYALSRKGNFGQLRRVAAPNETVNIVPNVTAGGPKTATVPFPSRHFLWPDLPILEATGVIEILSSDYDKPRVWSYSQFAGPVKSLVFASGFGGGGFGVTSFGG